MDDASVIEVEMNRADAVLADLAGETVETLSVHSLEAADAPFLGLIISKLSPMIGNLLERRIIQILDHESEHGLRWVRQDPGFPDALLVDRAGNSTEAGYEVKAWYALSTELTGRFRESQNLLAPRNVRVVVVAWCMSHIVYGQPYILGVLTVPGIEVAVSRDKHYHNPPAYLTVEPLDTTARTRNLQQTNVSGYRLQETDPIRIAAAQTFVAQHANRDDSPHTVGAQILNQELMTQYQYRLDTNFAKIDRVDNPDIEGFKSEILAIRTRSRTISAWSRLLKDLGSDSAPTRARAEQIMQSVYDDL